MKTEYLVTVQSPDGKPSIGLPSETLATISDLFRVCLRWVDRFGIGPTASSTAKLDGWEVTVSRYYPSDADKDTEHGSGQEEANQ